MYPRHVARGLCPGPRVHVHSDGDGLKANGQRLWTSLCPGRASRREDPTPPEHHHTSDVGVLVGLAQSCRVRWVPVLGTHEDEEARGALGKEDLLQTAEQGQGQGQGAGVMDLRSCTQDGVAAGQQGLPQRDCQPGLSRLARLELA